MIILDTDIIIWILRDNRDVIARVDTIVQNEPTAVSPITIAEIYKNVYPIEVVNLEEFLSRQIVIEVSGEIAKTAGYYWQEFHKRIKNLSILDCLIAATAKAEGAKLMTLNTRHFPMKDIHFLPLR